MYRNTKIATCSYCGARSALVLDRGRHELICPSCGAPLHALKAMQVKPGHGKGAGGRDGAPARRPGSCTPHKAPHQPPHGPARAGPPSHRWSDAGRARRPKSWTARRKRKLVKKVFEEAFDFIEDIFD